MNYSSLKKYADAIKETFIKWAQINYSLLNETLINFFFMKLNENLRFYIFNLIIISNNLGWSLSWVKPNEPNPNAPIGWVWGIKAKYWVGSP